jgi:hypothetical protein
MLSLKLFIGFTFDQKEVNATYGVSFSTNLHDKKEYYKSNGNQKTLWPQERGPSPYVDSP